MKLQNNVGKGLLEDVKQKQEERDRAYAEGQCMTDEELVRKSKVHQV